MVVQGDNLQFLKTCYLNQDSLIKDKVKGKIKLIYIDPPFATKSDFEGADGEYSYQDKIDNAEFLEALRERLIFMKELLADDGTIYVHFDYKMSHYVKLVLDDVFGKGNFLNEIVWAYFAFKRKTTRKFPQKHDTILSYCKNRTNYVWNTQYKSHSEEYLKRWKTDEDGRRYRDDVNPTKGGTRVIYLDEIEGDIVDSVWDDIPPVNPVAQERVDYPTQKPEALIQRIVQASTNRGDLVVDLFAGSGTTAAVAEKLGRRWIVCDFGKHAIYTMQRRMIDISNSQKLLQNGVKKKKGNYQTTPRPFCVLSVGAYDFTQIMNLRPNQEAYVSFVLEMFAITDQANYEKKYSLKQIYGQKDGNPVMVFPVWDDEYLKNIRIDKEYLKGLLDQTGGKLKGDMYIVCPETCTTVSDTEFKNARNQKIIFRLLTFPYKVLEEVSRNFQIEEQPSSAANINNLVSSVGFYFNQEVTLKVKKSNGGFEIKGFDTAITDREGKRFDGLDGLAMILVDADYDGEVFKIDAAIYQNDIKDNKASLQGLGARSALIAIDKFGNESKITVVK